MLRNVRYVTVELGKCEHCHKDAGDHAIDGLCGPMSSSHERHADVPEPCFRGMKQYAFIDLDSDEVHGWMRSAAVAEETA